MKRLPLRCLVLALVAGLSAPIYSQDKKAEPKSKAIGITLLVLAEDDADDAFFNQFSDRIKKLSAYVWRCTEGNFYLDVVTIKDKTALSHEELFKQKGTFLIKKGLLNRDSIPGMGAIDAMAGMGDADTWWVDCAGKPGIDTLCHEAFHGYFMMMHCGESFCIMKPSSHPNEVLSLCDDTNHKPSSDGFPQKESCWSIIQKKFPGVKRPAKGEALPAIPETKITVKNQ